MLSKSSPYKIVTFSLLILNFTLVSSLSAGAPDTLWTKMYGGFKDDYAQYGCQTNDGGYIVCGGTLSYSWGYSDVWLLKTDSLGDTLWTRTYGGEGIDVGYTVQQTTDGGYIISAYTDSFIHGKSIWLVKTDSLGDTLWTKAFGGDDAEGIGSARQTTDGGYIIVGSIYRTISGVRERAIWLIKTDSNGDTLWTKTYGGSKEEYSESVFQTADNGYIICGYSNSFVVYDGNCYLIRTDSLGDTLWTQLIEGNTHGFEAQETKDGGVIACGSEFLGTPQHNDIILVRLDRDGTIMWKKTYGGNRSDRARSVQQTADGGFILVGDTESYTIGWEDIWILRTDPSGDTLWTKLCGSIKRDKGSIIRQTKSGRYIIFGKTEVMGVDTSNV